MDFIIINLLVIKKGSVMKKLVQILMLVLVVLFIGACSFGYNSSKADYDNKPIDKTSDVADTSMEEADQLDPDIIEGNLEDNDFKN